MMHANVNRIEAERDIRTLSLQRAAASSSHEAATQALQALKEEMGVIFEAAQRVKDDEIRAGLNRLKQIAAGGK